METRFVGLRFRQGRTSLPEIRIGFAGDKGVPVRRSETHRAGRGGEETRRLTRLRLSIKWIIFFLRQGR